MNRTIELLFSTPVTQIKLDNQSLIKKYRDLIVNSISEENLLRLNKLGNVCTDDNLNTLPEFKDLYELIDKEIKDFFKGYLGLSPLDVRMTCMWANIHGNKGIHQIHQHPNAYYSGVLYLDAPNDDKNESSSLVFIDPRPAKNMTHPNYTKTHGLSERSVVFKPETGLLMFFPSWLEHGTETSILEDNKYRISVSFNYVLTSCYHFTMKI